ETACAWKYALSQMSSPVALVLSRQALPPLQGSIGAMDGLPRGAYVIGREHRSDIDALIIATGSEVHLALEAQKQLRAEDVSVRVVSMPSVELFVQQPDQYRNDVLPVGVKRRLVVEMGSPFGWHVFAGDEGEVYGISTYGASAPGSVVMEQYGFTAAHIAARVRALCQHKQ
ncbi:MAG: transketolase, partial [Paenibacillaceae bacterium]|nr:transketolase [Paenibacillaceae bacterium]